MESSQLTGDDGEECNSNESGWTMYLVSPRSSDDVKANDSGESNVEDGSGYSNGRSKEDYTNYGDGDYDSLASDASTGPAQVKVLNGKEKKNHGKNDSSRHERNKDEKEETHMSSNKKVGRTKKGEEKTTRKGYNKRRSSSRTSFW
ncbi:hypothetical protein PR202_gb22337 [Eleusine coracana subsp. coracana]|uniref:Uncharacterized protein n=1 Tax=Eleusine coracana subsp. coracana TaxID=191504 RepID=A0AAV5FH11_ELECO|nr:hypothetical protein QOZ80_6AG0538460 [Eleusine coracana subsp. coracana]GJN33715.1 hypothetical protein PR202_gb22337 [Eleusine coracana subsp. coracana]